MTPDLLIAGFSISEMSARGALPDVVVEVTFEWRTTGIDRGVVSGAHIQLVVILRHKGVSS